jgi:hypothetical protein
MTASKQSQDGTQFHPDSPDDGLRRYPKHVEFYVCVSVLELFLRCPTPRLHCFLSSHWPSFRFLFEEFYNRIKLG